MNSVFEMSAEERSQVAFEDTMYQNTPTIVNIATHDGVFHPDEVCAVAIYKILHPKHEVNVWRTRNAERLQQAHFRFDVGLKYNPEEGDFDHHQDRALPASCNLVWDYFTTKLNMDTFVVEHIRKTILNPISGLDRDFQNFVKENPIGIYKTFGQCIMDFNCIELGLEAQDGAFDRAVQFTMMAIQNAIRQAEQMSDNIDMIRNAKVEGQSVLILPRGISYNDYKEHLYPALLIVYPDPAGDGWCVVSMNTSKINLAKTSTEGCVFSHPAGFFTKWVSKESAVNFAKNRITWI